MSNPTKKATSPTVSQRLDELFKPWNTTDAPGLVVGVAHGGKTIYRRGFGLASVQHGVANTWQTRMRIGSTTKHFACLAALLLAEEGKLDVDAPVTRYFPELPQLEGVPTLRQFMTHTGGYHCNLAVAAMANGYKGVMPKGWVLKALARQTAVNFAPNRGQTYNNGGYQLLSLAIDRAAGMPFEQYLKERILLPLGMHDTEAVQNDFNITPGVASLHVPSPDGGWRHGAFPNEEMRGEGSMVSSVEDMLRWLAHLNGPKVVGSAEVWRQIFETAQLENGLKSVYSLGLMQHRYRGVDVVHHAGGVVGGNSQMITVPEHGLNIAIMVNGALVSATELGFKVIDAILGEQLTVPALTVPEQAPYQHLVGARYHGRSGMLIGFGDIGGKGEKLGFSLFGMPFGPLVFDMGETIGLGFEHAAIGPLSMRKADLAATPEGSAPPFIELSESGYVERLERVSNTPLDAAELAPALCGRYRSHGLAADAEVVLEDGGLVMVMRGEFTAARRLKLDPLSAQALIVHDAETPINTVAMTIEERSDKVRSFRLDATRARHLRFERV